MSSTERLNTLFKILNVEITKVGIIEVGLIEVGISKFTFVIFL